MLEGVRKHLSHEAMGSMERAIGTRATAVMHWVLQTLYAAGIGLAWWHRAALAQPLASSFGLLLALSVFGHFVTAMLWRRRGVLDGRRSRRLQDLRRSQAQRIAQQRNPDGSPFEPRKKAPSRTSAARGCKGTAATHFSRWIKRWT